MPPRPRRRQYREPIAPGEFHQVVREYLLTGKHPEADAPSEVREIPWEPGRAERLWKLHRSELLAEAKRRGFSPFAAALFECASPLPRLPQWHVHVADPRGLLDRCAAIWPCQHCGSHECSPSTCLS
jgi:hypothetical protein